MTTPHEAALQLLMPRRPRRTTEAMRRRSRDGHLSAVALPTADDAIDWLRSIGADDADLAAILAERDHERSYRIDPSRSLVCRAIRRAWRMKRRIPSLTAAELGRIVRRQVSGRDGATIQDFALLRRIRLEAQR
jgi:hypothetical protein